MKPMTNDTRPDLTIYPVLLRAEKAFREEADWYRVHMGQGPNRYDLQAILTDRMFLSDDPRVAAARVAFNTALTDSGR